MDDSFDILCIDEHDSANLSELKYKSRADIKNEQNRRHFGISGVIIPANLYPSVNTSGRKIQEKYEVFAKNTPFHYVEILNNKKKFAFLGVNQPLRTSITKRLDNYVKNTDFKLLYSFIDKHQLALDYGIFKQGVGLVGIKKIKPNISKAVTLKQVNLYDITLRFLLKEYYEHLKINGRRGIIIAEARGEKEDEELLNTFYNYQKFGAGSLTGNQLRSCVIDLLIVLKKQNHLGLQLSDLVNYPLYDSHIPNHNKRTDHFIALDSYESKILNGIIFPQQKRSS